MKWIEIQEENIDRVNAQIKKACDIYCLLYLKIKVERQQRILELSGREVDPLKEQEFIGDELLNKLPNEWKEMEKEQLVEELNRSLRQRSQEIDRYISTNSMKFKSREMDEQRVNFEEFKKNERIKKKLKYSKDVLRKTLKKFPLALLNELDRKIRNLLVGDEVLNERTQSEEDGTGDPMKFIERQFGGGRTESEIDEEYETIVTASTDTPREVIYKIILNKQEFEELQMLRKRKFNTSKFLKKGEGTFFKKGHSRSKVKVTSRRKRNKSKKKQHRHDPYIEDMMYEAKYLNASEPYRDPIHIIPLRKDSDRRARGEGLVDEYMRDDDRADGVDNLNITNALNRMDESYSRRRKKNVDTEKPRWCSITKSLTTSNYDKNIFLGEMYRQYRY